MNREIERQIIFKGQCIDNNDPMRLGRIRAILKTENQKEREEANEIEGKKVYKEWDEKDPFVYKPLLPFFINTPPKNEEYVHLFYSNLDRRGSKDKYYIGGLFSSPTTTNFEPYDSAVTNIDEGSRNKKFQNLLSSETDFRNPKTKGIYSEPNDVSIDGRGTADIVIQDDTVVLRAGKNKPFKSRTLPNQNDNRSFLQLSNFFSDTETTSVESKYVFREENKKINTLVEYLITNPENDFDVFRGEIYIYDVRSFSANTSNINVTYSIPESKKSLMTTISFVGKTMNEVISLINKTLDNVIKGDIKGEINQNNENVTYEGNDIFRDQFPIYFRPTLNFFNKLNQSINTNVTIKKNIVRLMDGVKSIPKQENGGYGLIYDKKKGTSAPFKPKVETFNNQNTTNSPKSVGILGSDELYILSHKTKKFTGEKINLSDTIYKIDESKVVDELLPKTSSLVRGEELLELIQLMVRFMLEHVHPWHQLPPDTETSSGVKSSDIRTELQNAYDKILNKKIRIN